MLVIADSSALIALAMCGVLEIVTLVYEDIRVPQAVFDEVSATDKPQGVVLASFLAERVVSVDMSVGCWPRAGWDKESWKRWRLQTTLC